MCPVSTGNKRIPNKVHFVARILYLATEICRTDVNCTTIWCGVSMVTLKHFKQPFWLLCDIVLIM